MINQKQAHSVSRCVLSRVLERQRIRDEAGVNPAGPLIVAKVLLCVHLFVTLVYVCNDVSAGLDGPDISTAASD